VAPGDRRTGGHRLQQRRSRLGVGGLGDLLRRVEVVPEDDRVLDQPLASLGHLLVRLLGLVQLPPVADRDRPREAVGALDLVELTFDGLTQLDVVDVAQEEDRLEDLAERLQRSIEGMLLRVRVQAAEQVRGGGLLEPDRRDESQDLVPLLLDQFDVDIAGWAPASCSAWPRSNWNTGESVRPRASRWPSAGGVYHGRQQKGTTKGKPARARQLRDQGLSVWEIAQALAVSDRTVFRPRRTDSATRLNPGSCETFRTFVGLDPLLPKHRTEDAILRDRRVGDQSQ
jgi:hypothetical protein